MAIQDALQPGSLVLGPFQGVAFRRVHEPPVVFNVFSSCAFQDAAPIVLLDSNCGRLMHRAYIVCRRWLWFASPDFAALSRVRRRHRREILEGRRIVDVFVG